MAEWSRVVATTISDYVRGAEENILRNRKLLAMMRERGRLVMNQSGKDIDWGIQYKQAPMQGYADMDVITFQRRDYWKRATLDWRGYQLTDAQSKKERLMNRSTEALIKIYSEIASILMKSAEDAISTELYIDGNAAGNEKKIHGIESFMANSGVIANGYVANPSDTYAGLSTALAGVSGTWDTSGGTTTWPIGTGTTDYDFWSPLLVDYTDTAWDASTKTWPNTCVEALRFGILYSEQRMSSREKLDVILLDTKLYYQFLNKQETKEQLNVRRGDGDSELYRLGFRDMVNFDGVDVTKEYGVPVNVGYGWCMDNCELRSMQDTLFKPDGPIYSEETKTDRFGLDFFGNMTFNPRYFMKFAAYT